MNVYFKVKCEDSATRYSSIALRTKYGKRFYAEAINSFGYQDHKTDSFVCENLLDFMTDRSKDPNLTILLGESELIEKKLNAWIKEVCVDGYVQFIGDSKDSDAVRGYMTLFELIDKNTNIKVSSSLFDINQLMYDVDMFGEYTLFMTKLGINLGSYRKRDRRLALNNLLKKLNEQQIVEEPEDRIYPYKSSLDDLDVIHGIYCCICKKAVLNAFS